MLNSGQIGVNTNFVFGLNRRRFSRGTQEPPDARRLFSQTKNFYAVEEVQVFQVHVFSFL